jgi:hypothetical protein
VARRNRNAQRRPRPPRLRLYGSLAEFAEHAAKQLGAAPDAEVFIRGCGRCGYLAASLDELIMGDKLVCPDCSHQWKPRAKTGWLLRVRPTGA